MELVSGRSLDRWLVERERSWLEVLEVFVQAARGLAAAHRAGLVHRDFKPENVLVGEDGRVRVVEVGPRDGLQSESKAIDTAAKIELINRLSSASRRLISRRAMSICFSRSRSAK